VQTLTKKLTEAGLQDKIITDSQLKRLLDGSAQRRYHLVNRATKAGELMRLRRGLYVLAKPFRSRSCHPFAVAQMVEPGSYVSLQSALSFHGWIPETVYSTTSIVPGRKAKEYLHEQFGQFTFHPLAIQTGYFLEVVERTQIDQQMVLLANPLRALMDLVCLNKVEWQGLDWIEQSMRIDSDSWEKITCADFQALKPVYKQKRVRNFMNKLETALGLNPRRQEHDHE